MTSFKMKLHFYERYFIGMLFSFVSRKYAVDLFNKFTASIKGDKFVTVPMGSKYYLGEMLPREVLFPPQMGIFKGIEAPIPNDVHTYLTNLYGDYMQLPPVEQRVGLHCVINFSLDTTKEK